MLDQYYTLFQLIAQNASNLAEQSMEAAQRQGNLGSYRTAKEMRDDYSNLFYKLKDRKEIDIQDARRLYVASTLMVAKLQSDLTKLQTVIDDYQNNLIPRLKTAIEDEENFLEKIQENFS